MVVCKYYLEGTCKFGRQCRFEHIRSSSTSSGINSSASANPFISLSSLPESNVNGTATTNINASLGKATTDDKLSQIKEELNNPSIWPFSSFGIPGYKDICIQGKDLSMEEVRWDAYQEFKRTGSIQHHMQAYKQNEIIARQERLQFLAQYENELRKGHFQSQSIQTNSIFGPNSVSSSLNNGYLNMSYSNVVKDGLNQSMPFANVSSSTFSPSESPFSSLGSSLSHFTTPSTTENTQSQFSSPFASLETSQTTSFFQNRPTFTPSPFQSHPSSARPSPSSGISISMSSKCISGEFLRPLNEEEIHAFNSPAFHGKVPEHPPPSSLCHF